MRQVTILAFAAALLAASAQAWWCTGHMVIAEIARQNLDSGVEDRVNAQFQWLNQWFPQTDNMVSGACWADDLKSQKLEVMAGWHFVNQVYNPENIPMTTKNYPIQRINVETAIADLDKTVKEGRDENDWIKAYATANLVHFFGDIHQPLHATDRFNSVYPDGDRGGNAIDVYLAGQKWVLHFVWDSVCGQYVNEPKRPLDNQDYAWIQSLAGQYMANFSVPAEQQKVWNSTVMALESFEAAVKYAYWNNTIVANQTLSDEYISVCEQVAGYRIAFAGYRLAHELNYLFHEERHAKTRGTAILSRIREAREDYQRLAGRRV